MKCPFCGFENTKVIDSRPADDTNSIRRRRHCESCHHRFTTYEKYESLPLVIVKKDHSREPYNRDKLMAGIVRSCHKRPVSMAAIEKATDEIENALYNSLDKEIESSKIGEMVMDALKDMDQVAYVRFASVYREFKDINTFMNELKKMLKESK